jgi:transmembrane sensor
MIERIAQLVVRHLQGELTDDENQELQAWIYQSKENELAFEKAIDPENLKEGLKREFDKEERILDQLKSEIESEEGVIFIRARRKWYRYVAAAAIIMLLGAGAFVVFFNNQEKQPAAVKVPEVKDVKAPETNRAMITLASGQKVYLDNAKNGMLATEGNVNLVKLADGQIAYNGSAKNVVYNTLNNPRGSKVVSLLLSDGTKVWLGCESSLHYPVAFVGTERKVEVTGEVYFEVAKDARRPFKVIKTGSDIEIEVLGTKFNVNTYHDGPAKVTLLEGSVKVKREKASVVIKPGQQVEVLDDPSANSDQQLLKVISNPNIDDVMAWKNNYFMFSNADVVTIMKQVSRWYDVEIEFQKEINAKYSFLLTRDIPVSRIFKIFEATDGIHFKIEGKKIIVMPR